MHGSSVLNTLNATCGTSKLKHALLVISPKDRQVSAKDNFITHSVVQRKLWLNIIVNEPLSRDENETRCNVNAGHVTMTIIKCIMQYCWRLKTMLKCLHFRWPKRDETKCYNVISSRLVTLLLLFCSISVSCISLQRLHQVALRKRFLKPHSRHYLEDDNKQS